MIAAFLRKKPQYSGRTIPCVELESLYCICGSKGEHKRIVFCWNLWLKSLVLVCVFEDFHLQKYTRYKSICDKVKCMQRWQKTLLLSNEHLQKNHHSLECIFQPFSMKLHVLVLKRGWISPFPLPSWFCRYLTFSTINFQILKSVSVSLSSEPFPVVMLHLEAKGGTTVEYSCNIQTHIHVIICHLTPFSGLYSFLKIPNIWFSLWLLTWVNFF